MYTVQARSQFGLPYRCTLYITVLYILHAHYTCQLLLHSTVCIIVLYTVQCTGILDIASLPDVLCQLFQHGFEYNFSSVCSRVYSAQLCTSYAGKVDWPHFAEFTKYILKGCENVQFPSCTPIESTVQRQSEASLTPLLHSNRKSMSHTLILKCSVHFAHYSECTPWNVQEPVLTRLIAVRCTVFAQLFSLSTQLGMTELWAH